MKFLTKTAIIAMILVGGVAYAKGERTDPNAKARSDLMRTIGQNIGVLGDMAGGKAAFDATAAETAKAALITASAGIGAAFEVQGAADPASEAKPEIWTNWDEFLEDAGKLNAAATALDATSVEGVQAGMGALGGACKDCHTEFRM
jgi:cytochrome c556